MKTPITLQGRSITEEDLCLIRELLQDNPSWSRYRLSRELALHWDWRNGTGQIKDIACRTLLRKLDAMGGITLPAPKGLSPNRFRHLPVKPVTHERHPISGSLAQLQPIRLLDASRPKYSALFAWLLASCHYLSYRQPVGENMLYLAVDRYDRPLACLLFGSAAWSCAARDLHLGWSYEQRRKHLHLLTNNHRFLILPWVQVPCLASHLLGMVSRQIQQDWLHKYGHTILMLETFVEQRFSGTCYRAANWQCVGQTTGRTRNGRHGDPLASVKDIYLYSLQKRAHRRLCHAQ